MVPEFTPCFCTDFYPCVQVVEDGDVSVCDLDGDVMDCSFWTAVGPMIRGDAEDGGGAFEDAAQAAARVAVAQSAIAKVEPTAAGWRALPGRPTASIRLSADGLPERVLLAGDDDCNTEKGVAAGSDLENAIAEACGLKPWHVAIDHDSWDTAEGGPEVHARIGVVPC
jgi:hypothetical protein